MKIVRIWKFSGPYFAAFELNTERYGVSLRIQYECGKIRTRETLNTDTFHALDIEETAENRFSNNGPHKNTYSFSEFFQASVFPKQKAVAC